MKCIAYCLLPVALIASRASEFKIPQFQSEKAAGGFIDRIAFGAVIGPGSSSSIDYFPFHVDAKAGVLVIPIEWSTPLDEKTGEVLRAECFWRIPTRVLGESKYILSVERESFDEIVFTIRKPDSDRPFLKSPKCRILKTEFGKELHGTRVDTRLKAEPNKVPEATPDQRPTPVQCPSSGSPQL